MRAFEEQQLEAKKLKKRGKLNEDLLYGLFGSSRSAKEEARGKQAKLWQIIIRSRRSFVVRTWQQDRSYGAFATCSSGLIDIFTKAGTQKKNQVFNRIFQVHRPPQKTFLYIAKFSCIASFKFV